MSNPSPTLLRLCRVCSGSGAEIVESRRAPLNQSGVQGRAEVIASRPHPAPHYPSEQLLTIRRDCTACGGRGTFRDTNPAYAEQLRFETDSTRAGREARAARSLQVAA